MSAVEPVVSPAVQLTSEMLDALATHLHLALSQEQCDALLRFIGMLHRWNGTHNLTSVRTAEGMWTQHLADCLSVIPSLQACLPAGRLLDVGSGGGLPGIVIAICMPAVNVVCVDAVGKKAAFVRQVAGELRLANLHSAHARVEALALGVFDIVTSRAFASLANFVALTQTQLAPAGVWMAMKGQRPDAEMASLPMTVAVFHVEQLHVPGLDAQRCLVWMRPAPAKPAA